MINVGEQLVASYLRHIRGCDFTQMNVYTVESQGEIDVVGVNLKEKRAYFCEVTVHLVTGLTYVDGRSKKTNNVNKLTEKFSRDIAYAETFMADYERHYMLWSPLVKKRGKDDQRQHLEQIAANVRKARGVDIEFVVNEKFLAAMEEMRAFAAKETAALQCPLMRLMQIEAYLKRHVGAKAPAAAVSPVITPIQTQPAKKVPAQPGSASIPWRT